MKKIAIAALIAGTMMPSAGAQTQDNEAEVSETAVEETGISAEDEAEEEDSGPTYNKYQMATLRALDKIPPAAMHSLVGFCQFAEAQTSGRSGAVILKEDRNAARMTGKSGHQ